MRGFPGDPTRDTSAASGAPAGRVREPRDLPEPGQDPQAALAS